METLVSDIDLTQEPHHAREDTSSFFTAHLTGVHTEGLPVGQIKAGEPLILTGVGLGGQISSAVAIALDLQ